MYLQVMSEMCSGKLRAWFSVGVSPVHRFIDFCARLHFIKYGPLRNPFKSTNVRILNDSLALAFYSNVKLPPALAPRKYIRYHIQNFNRSAFIAEIMTTHKKYIVNKLQFTILIKISAENI